jgi:hypothetical protein
LEKWFALQKILIRSEKRQEGESQMLKGSVDGLVDIGADKITVENEER